MQRLQSIFFAACATIVAVGIWVAAIGFNLLIWLFGNGPRVQAAAWGLALVSTLVFFPVFYRHFSRGQQNDSRA